VARLRDEGLAGNAEREGAEKAVASARATLDALGGAAGAAVTTLLAPRESVVVEVPAQEGAWVTAGQVALTLAPRDAVVVRAGVEQVHAAKLEEGTPVEIAPVFGTGSDTPLRATVWRVQQRVDVATQLVAVLVRVEAPPAWLAVGASVRLRVVIASGEGATLVPRAALLRRGAETGVFAIEDGHARWRPIVVGVRGDQVVEATAGVGSGVRVATVGRSSLADGLRIRADAADAAP
jgi:hypothetical protein